MGHGKYPHVVVDVEFELVDEIAMKAHATPMGNDQDGEPIVINFEQHQLLASIISDALIQSVEPEKHGVRFKGMTIHERVTEDGKVYLPLTLGGYPVRQDDGNYADGV